MRNTSLEVTHADFLLLNSIVVAVKYIFSVSGSMLCFEQKPAQWHCLQQYRCSMSGTTIEVKVRVYLICQFYLPGVVYIAVCCGRGLHDLLIPAVHSHSYLKTK